MYLLYVVIVIVIFLSVALIIAIIWYVSAKNSYQQCQTTENLACPTYVCGQTAGTTKPECVTEESLNAYPPYRIDSEGKVHCQPSGLEPVIYPIPK